MKFSARIKKRHGRSKKLEELKKIKKVNRFHLLEKMLVSAILFTLLSAVSAKYTGKTLL